MASRARGRRTRPSSGATRSSTAAAEDPPTYRPTHRKTDLPTERPPDLYLPKDRPTYRPTHRKTDLPTALPTERPPDLPKDRPTFISYTASGGGQVYIRFPINPWAVFGLTNAASRDSVKMAFRSMITQPQRQNRALASLANHMLTSTEPRYQRLPGDLYTIRNRDHFTIAAYGNTEELRVLIRKNKSLVKQADEHGRTLLYLACKSGFYDMVKMLLEKGAEINKIQRDGSTPLHAAAFFGQSLVVGLLLEYGAQTDIKNKWGQTALQEGHSTDITNLITNASSDLIF